MKADFNFTTAFGAFAEASEGYAKATGGFVAKASALAFVTFVAGCGGLNGEAKRSLGTVNDRAKGLIDRENAAYSTAMLALSVGRNAYLDAVKRHGQPDAAGGPSGIWADFAASKSLEEAVAVATRYLTERAGGATVRALRDTFAAKRKAADKGGKADEADKAGKGDKADDGPSVAEDAKLGYSAEPKPIVTADDVLAAVSDWSDADVLALSAALADLVATRQGQAAEAA